MKLYKNPPSGSRDDTHADGRMDRRAEMTKLIFAFRKLSNSP